MFVTGGRQEPTSPAPRQKPSTPVPRQEATTPVTVTVVGRVSESEIPSATMQQEITGNIIFEKCYSYHLFYFSKRV